jgi:hypothetical protein
MDVGFRRCVCCDVGEREERAIGACVEDQGGRVVLQGGWEGCGEARGEAGVNGDVDVYVFTGEGVEERKDGGRGDAADAVDKDC